ncbi:sensor histidine kinase [Nitrospira sp. Nam74]
MSSLFHGIRWKFVTLVGVLLFALLGSLYQTYLIVHNRQADAVIIDLAGRQRMLIERHLKQVSLASQGFPVDHLETGHLLLQRIDVLIAGGQTIRDIGEETVVTLPPAQTERIADKFREQKVLLKQFLAKEWAFLDEPFGTQESVRAREEVIHLNEALVKVANEAVTLMSQHSESKIERIVRWDVIEATLAGIFGLVLTVQLWKTHHELQRETMERQHAQQRALQALRQSDDLKSALLSSVSHELRTPLTAIQSLVSGAQDANGDVRRELLDGVREEARYLSHLVDNMLDMSRVEAGALHPNRDWHLLEELIEVAIRRLGAALEHRHLRIDLPDSLPTVFVDATELQLVFINLLDNAVKYSPEGSAITVQAAVVPGMVEVRVSNNGEGIPPDDLDRVFERFYRTERAVERRISGTGLGLAICRAVIQAHGGDIRVISSAGETTILFRLPLVPEPLTGMMPPLPSFDAGQA